MENLFTWIFHKNRFRECLLWESVDNDWDRGVDGVVQEQEHALEQGRPGKVWIDGKQQLACETRNLRKKSKKYIRTTDDGC